MKIKMKLTYVVVVCFLLGSVGGAIFQQVAIFQAPISSENPKSAASTLYMNFQDANTSFIAENGRYLSEVVQTGDLNGDLINDFLIDTRSFETALAKIYVIFGKYSGWPTEKSLSTADASFLGEHVGKEITIAGVGDVNGDLRNDILVGCSREDHTKGKSYLIFGKSSGWSQNVNMSNVDATFLVDDKIYGTQQQSGHSVSGIGDVNGDSYDDFIIGAPQSDSNNPYMSDCGKSFLFFGRPSGWAQNDNLSNADVVIVGENMMDRSGSEIAGVGDVNWDGFDDFLVWAPSEGSNYVGKTYLILGRVSGWKSEMSLSEANASFIGENINDHAGTLLSKAGDVNGDGYDDFLLGSITANKAYLVFGRDTGWSLNTSLSGANVTFIGENSGAVSAMSMSGAVNFNADGYDDIIIGAPNYDNKEIPGIDVGKTYIIYGRNSTDWPKKFNLANSNLALKGQESIDRCGSSITGVQSINLDFNDELLVLSHNVVYLFFGPLKGTTQSSPSIPAYFPIVALILVITLLAKKTHNQIKHKKGNF
jgi:hypothetical protein